MRKQQRLADIAVIAEFQPIDPHKKALPPLFLSSEAGCGYLFDDNTVIIHGYNIPRNQFFSSLHTDFTIY